MPAERSTINEAVCQRFEKAWQRGQPEPIEAFLPAAGDPGYRATLEELVHIELEWAWQAWGLAATRRGSAPDPPDRVEAYQARFPGLGAPPVLLRLLGQEYRVRQLYGDRPSANEYRARFPALVVSGREVEAALADGEASDDLPRLPGYQVLGFLGKGGMGVVYKARHVGLQRLVALKMIVTGAGADAEELARFRAEAETLAQLQHPHIVQVYDVGECRPGGAGPPVPYFALEYVAGGTLAEYLAGKPQPARAAAGLVETLARAVHAAHQQGIVHRDLKPANILLASGGRQPPDNGTASGGSRPPLAAYLPKITDFGLAKRLDGTAGRTATGAVLGTPSYMAPEQAAGRAKEVGPATDVWALGAILYELLSGRPPFQAETPLSTLEQVRTLEPVAPSRLQPKVPRDLETICLKCLEKEPPRRYASAEDLAEDLRRFQAGEPIRARRIGPAGRLVRWCRRKPALASTVAGALLAVAAVAAVSFVQIIQERNLAQQERNRAQELAAGLALDKGVAFCEQGEVGYGLLWLAHSLEMAPEPAHDLRRVIRLNLAAWQPRVYPLRAQLAHDEEIWAAAYSPDGKTIATASKDGTARLWTAATGEWIGEPLRHQKPVYAVAFSPDGRTVATASGDGTARLWEAATGQSLGVPLRHQDAVAAVAFSPDGRRVVTGSPDKTARLWDAVTGHPIGPPLQHQGAVTAVAFHPDGRVLLTGCHDHTARLWEVATGNPLSVLRHQGYVTALAFSPDGRTVVTGSYDHTARLWEARTGNPLGHALQHQSYVTAVAFSPDSRIVLTGSGDDTARLWDATTGQPLGLPLPHQGAVTGVAFSPDGRTFVTGDEKRIARLWDTATAKPLGAPLRHPGGLLGVAFGPDGRTILTRSADHTARLWDVSRTQSPDRRLLHPDVVWVVAYSPDGRAVLTASGPRHAPGVTQLWDAQTGAPRGPPLRHPETPTTVAVGTDGKTILVGTYGDGKTGASTVRLWDATTGKPLGEPLPHQGMVTAVALSPDGQTMLTSSISVPGARLWDVATGQPRGPVLAHDEAVRSAVFSRDGQTLLTGSYDKTAKLWDAATGRPLGVVLRHPGQVGAVALSSDARFILTGTDADYAQLWDAATGEPLGAPLQHQHTVRAVAFSPDGRLLLTGSGDKTARLWDRVTGKPVGPPLRHEGNVESVAFSPDGQTVVTGGWDKAARFWEIPTPVDGPVDRVVLWVQVHTAMELDPAGAIRILDGSTWRQRVQDLQAQGGPLVPP